jgi:hypothetical protein
MTSYFSSTSIFDIVANVECVIHVLLEQQLVMIKMETILVLQLIDVPSPM